VGITSLDPESSCYYAAHPLVSYSILFPRNGEVVGCHVYGPLSMYPGWVTLSEVTAAKRGLSVLLGSVWFQSQVGRSGSIPDSGTEPLRPVFGKLEPSRSVFCLVAE
jgi:hypothetical protein